MEFVWKPSGLSPCGSCRVSKKRCYHLETGGGTDKHDQGLSSVADAGDEGGERSPEAQNHVLSPNSSQSPSRVSAYNPESVLEDISNAPDSASTVDSARQHPTLSPFTESPDCERERSPSNAPRNQRKMLWYRSHRRSEGPLNLSAAHRSYLEECGALLELPRGTTDALLPIYNSILDDLIPILDGKEVFRDYSNGDSSIYLVRAICLVTCKTAQAAPFLRLEKDGPVLDSREFSSRLLAGLDAAIKADLERDRVTKVQILTLMHFNNDDIRGKDRASGCLSQAIAEAWSLSLHLKMSGNPDQEQTKFLWWCLRNCDRLNKPIMGAGPFMIDDTDIGIERISPESVSYRSQIMAISLRLGDLVATSTKVYKASCKSTIDGCQDFPVLSELTDGIHFERFHRSHRDLEIWYHLCAMLSCRYNGPGSVQYKRRLASADEAVQIICREGHESLPALPLVPYSMSMATAVIYRALRDDQPDSNSAYQDISSCCDMLDVLSKQWPSTKGIARLAKRLWKLLSMPPGSVKNRATPGENRQQPEANPSQSRVVGISATSTIGPANNLDSAHAVIAAETGTISTNYDATIPQVGASTQLVSRPWPDIDASYLQLDRAFYDLFDYSLPNVLQDPSSSDYFPITTSNEYFRDIFSMPGFSEPEAEQSDTCFQNMDSNWHHDA